MGAALYHQIMAIAIVIPITNSTGRSNTIATAIHYRDFRHVQK